LTSPLCRIQQNGAGSTVKTQLNKAVEFLLLIRQYVSALALGYRQISRFVSEETIQCGMYLAHVIQRDLVANVTINNCQERLASLDKYLCELGKYHTVQ